MTFLQRVQLFAVLALAGCEGDVCAEAVTEVTSTIESVCGERAFVASWYCTTCLTTGNLSVDDKCRCRPLVYGDDACLYEVDESGEDAVRSAIDAANTRCTPPPGVAGEVQ